MNTAGIKGKGVGIYGVGPMASTARTQDLSAFVSAVAEGSAGGTFGTDARFIVGGFSDSLVIRAGATAAQRADTAARFVADTYAGQAVGFWRDTETGRTWLDVVRGFDTLYEAIMAAESNGELAFYDTVRCITWRSLENPSYPLYWAADLNPDSP